MERKLWIKQRKRVQWFTNKNELRAYIGWNVYFLQNVSNSSYRRVSLLLELISIAQKNPSKIWLYDLVKINPSTIHDTKYSKRNFIEFETIWNFWNIGILSRKLIEIISEYIEEKITLNKAEKWSAMVHQ